MQKIEYSYDRCGTAMQAEHMSVMELI